VIDLVSRPLSEEEKGLAAQFCESGQAGILSDTTRSEEQLTNMVLQRNFSPNQSVAEMTEVKLVELERLRKISEETKSVLSTVRNSVMEQMERMEADGRRAEVELLVRLRRVYAYLDRVMNDAYEEDQKIKTILSSLMTVVDLNR
jgi:hypothetical protein